MSTPPWFETNKIDEAIALGQYKLPTLIPRGAFVEVSVLDGKVAVHTTGRIRAESFPNHYSEYVGYVRKDRKRRTRMCYTEYHDGRPYTVCTFLPNPITYYSNGRYKVTVVGRTLASSRSMSSLRSRVQGFTKSPWKGNSWSGPSVPLKRPNPEIIRRTVPVVLQTSLGTNSITPTQFTCRYREWTGTVTPGFNSKKRKALPDNNHTALVSEVGQNHYSWYQTQPSSGGYDYRRAPWTHFLPTPQAHLLEVPSVDDAALKKLISKAGQGIGANLAQNFAQANQLVTLIGGTAQRLVKSFTYLKRGNIPAATSVLLSGQPKSKWQGPKGRPSASKSVAQNWLQLQYGWKPLLSDINATLASIPTQSESGSYVQRVSSAASKANVAITPRFGDVLFGGKMIGTDSSTVITTVKYKLRFRLSDPYLAFAAQTGFTNPINLVWELLPLSFVADWFLPIGAYLEQLSAWDGCTFLGGSKVVFTRIFLESAESYGGASATESTVLISYSASYQREEVRLSRTRLENFPSPVLPSLNPQGLQAGVRAANAVALLTQLFK